jgi:hypothetical protein
MTLRIRIAAAEPETAICAHRRAMMHHAITCLGRNQGTSSLQVPGLTAAFTCGFRLYRGYGLLPRPVAGWRKRRISGVHSKSPLEFLEPFDQHQKTSTCRRPTLVPRLLRNTVRFDQRSFAHTRRMSEFTTSEKINSVNGYDALTRHRILVIILHLRRPLHFAGFDAK